MGTDQHMDKVRAIIARHKKELLALPGATGVGVGAGDAKNQYAIVVYMQSETTTGPSTLEGTQVKYVVTGTIRPLTSSATDN